MNKDVLTNKVLYVYVLLLSLLCCQAFSAERFEFYNGVRQLGMGGVAVATVNDETSLMLNPAGLGKLRNKFLTLADPEVEGGSKVYDYFEERDFNYSEITSPQDILNLLNASPDNHYHLKAQISPSIVVPNFGVGLLANWNYNAEVVSDTNEYYLRYRNDYAALLGYNLKLFDGRIKLGFNARYINRVEYEDTLPTTETNLSWDSLVSEGTGVASDVGLILTGPWVYLPTLAAVWRDVGDTSYNLGGGMFYSNRPEPEKTKSTVDVGFSLTPIIAKHIRVQIAGELRDVMDVEEEKDLEKRLHGGVEFNFYDHVFIRGGWNQRYWTAGLELAYQFIQIQAATYGEEIGTKDDPREDRRYVIKFAFRF